MRSALSCALVALLPNLAAADPLADLGKAFFFDSSLSATGAQSCASCHDPANGFSSDTAFPEGAHPGRFGNRKPPSIAYQALSPVFHHRMDEGDVLFVGGNMHDGRASGALTGNPAADQAVLPLLNPDEMALPHGACLAAKACAAQGQAMEALHPGVCALPIDAEATCAGAEPHDPAPQTDSALRLVGHALAAFEASADVTPFSSRFDDWVAGRGQLTPDEEAGFKLFDDKAQCSACHVLTAGPDGQGAMLTDFTYDNLGVPANPANPWYDNPANPQGRDWKDRGLAATLEGDAFYAPLAAGVEGAVKVPTLRNLWTGQPRAYMHNGWFTTLEGVVRFYNTRDVWPRCADGIDTEAAALANRCWPAPEVDGTVNRDELGNLKLTEAEEAQIVAFLKTLTDR